MPVLKISTFIITSITTCPLRINAILAIMSVSTFKTDVILYILTHLVRYPVLRTISLFHLQIQVYPLHLMSSGNLLHGTFVIIYLLYQQMSQIDSSLLPVNLTTEAATINVNNHIEFLRQFSSCTVTVDVHLTIFLAGHKQIQSLVTHKSHP